MRRLGGLIAVAALLASCGPGGDERVVVAQHSENQVTTTVELVRTGSGNLELQATYVPDAEMVHVHDKDLPPSGIDGFGRPTLFEIVSGDLLPTGSSTANTNTVSLTVAATDKPIPVYPDGPVVLTIPVEIIDSANEIVDIEVSLSYMACTSDGGCSLPVSDQRLTNEVRLPSGDPGAQRLRNE